MHWDPSNRFRQGPLASGTQGCYSTVRGAGVLCWAAGQPPATALAPSGTRRHGTGTVPAAGSVSGHFPAFRQSLRDGVISGSGSSISASEAAHSSPWALLWAQPRLLYNLGFPEKLKREMKDSYQSSHSVPPKPCARGVISIPAFLDHIAERGNLPRWGWRT